MFVIFEQIKLMIVIYFAHDDNIFLSVNKSFNLSTHALYVTMLIYNGKQKVCQLEAKEALL